jgi:hypothetical protein
VNLGYFKPVSVPKNAMLAVYASRLRMIIRNQVYLLHNLFDLRSHGRPEYFLRFRRQMKPVGTIGRDHRACVKEGCAPKVRNAFVKL